MNIYRVFKNVVDRVLALTLLSLLIVIPVIPVTMLAIFIEDPGNVFFIQKRVGKDGKYFKVIKFRSMYKDADHRIKRNIAEGVTDKLNFKSDSTAMVTKVGSIIRGLSIDELPQLLNIIKGDMAIIGPRPLQDFEVDAYCAGSKLRQDIMKKRLEVLPGLLCDWQVTANKEEMPFPERMLLDSQYAETESFSKDVSLLIRGMKTVIMGNNI